MELPRWLGVLPTTVMDLLDQSNYSAPILIVDDDKSNALTLCKLLEHAGYNNCTAMTDAAAAADQFLALNPDLVLLDLHMEPVSGLDVLARINQLVSPQNRPAILVL